MNENDSQNDLNAAEALNQNASVWMKRGIALLNANTPASLQQAVGCFDEAIALRQKLPLAAVPKFRYGLAACWMNRADALTRLGEKNNAQENLAEAVRSYDAALELLLTLPLNDDPLFRRRLAIAWQNRGLTLQTQGGASLPAAAESFKTAVAVLENERATEIKDQKILLATVWMNFANALILQNKNELLAEAKIAAEKSLVLIKPLENADLSAAETGFKARHILCQAIAELLWENSENLQSRKIEKSAVENWIAEATDIVDGGMALARAWEQKNIRQFRPLAFQLFRFGARVYQKFQPHFLTEFLLENFDAAHLPAEFVGSAEMRSAALESLWRAFRAMQRDGFKAINTPKFDQFLAQLRELRVVEERLTELRRKVH